MQFFNLNAGEWAGALEEIQQKAGYRFNDLGRLRLALTHSSYASENPSSPEWNERLEFLGDAVLELLVSRRLFDALPDVQEGTLTRNRSALVDEHANAGYARTLGLDRAILLGKSECRDGGRKRDSLLGDAFEAFLGAVYLDGGIEAAERVLAPLLPPVKDVSDNASKANPKGALQIFCQREFKRQPRYVDVSSSGPSHAPHFLCKVILPEGPSFEGEGVSKKAAEQAAAASALRSLVQNDATTPGEGQNMDATDSP